MDDDYPDHIRPLPTAKDEMRASVDALQRALPIMMELAPHIAAARRKMYDAHVEAGFTPAEALVLCQRMTL